MKPEKAVELAVAADISIMAISAAAEQLGVRQQIASAVLKISEEETKDAADLEEYVKGLEEGDPLALFRDLSIKQEPDYVPDEWSVVFKDAEGKELGEAWSPPISAGDDSDLGPADAPVGDGIELEEQIGGLEGFIEHLTRNVKDGAIASVLVRCQDYQFEDATELSNRWRKNEIQLSDDAKKKFHGFYIKVVSVEPLLEPEVHLLDAHGNILAQSRHNE